MTKVCHHGAIPHVALLILFSFFFSFFFFLFCNAVLSYRCSRDEVNLFLCLGNISLETLPCCRLSVLKQERTNFSCYINRKSSTAVLLHARDQL